MPLADLGEGIAARLSMLAAQEGARLSTGRLPDGGLTTEMELAPAELGRLKLTLQTGERGLQLSVIVERPESLDLVRRHLEGMHRNLLADGVRLDSIDVQSGASGQGGSPSDPGGGRPPAPSRPTSPDGRSDATDRQDPPPPPPPRTDPGRLDISL